MAQESVSHQPTNQTSENEHSRGRSPLGPILCWAVVFADIGTSVYYVPGILYNSWFDHFQVGFGDSAPSCS